MKKHRIIIAGSRTCPERSTELWVTVSELLSDLYFDFEDIEIVSGGAKGADKLGEWIASTWQAPVKQFLPDYERNGKLAPLFRNAEMALYGTQLIALWDGKSRGTAHMIQEAKNMGLPVIIIKI